jgi:hypothetical protein
LPVTRRPVDQLLAQSIDSVEQCELLVTMYLAPARSWTARELARELYLAEGPTVRDLEQLATRGLLEVRIANDVFFRVSPVSPQLAEAVSQLAELYRTNRVEVLSRIVRLKGRGLRHFAEAFDFRKGGAS